MVQETILQVRSATGKCRDRSPTYIFLSCSYSTDDKEMSNDDGDYVRGGLLRHKRFLLYSVWLLHLGKVSPQTGLKYLLFFFLLTYYIAIRSFQPCLSPPQLDTTTVQDWWEQPIPHSVFHQHKVVALASACLSSGICMSHKWQPRTKHNLE